MRTFLRIFLGLALLLGGLETVQAQPQAPAACCCGDEDTCPCPPPPPSAPRCPSPVQSRILVAPAEAPRQAEQRGPREEAHPCPVALRTTQASTALPSGLHPRPRPSPPGVRARLAQLSTFRN